MPVFEENKICNDLGMDEDWFLNFLYDANFKEETKKSELLLDSFSPISVLEPNNLSKENTMPSSSSSASSASSHRTSLSPSRPSKPLFPARARSKRPRKPITPAPPFTTLQIPAPEPTVKKIKIKVRSPDTEDPTGARKCRHCGIQKTPQWRADPMVPKTLCNACGVHYKSGRLFPEYRPAASPTFVPSIHSNSHKKVVEIRNKVIGSEDEKVYNPAAKNCDLLKYIRV